MEENKTIIIDSVLSDLLKWLISENYNWHLYSFVLIAFFWYKFESIKLLITGSILVLANGIRYDDDKKDFLIEIQRLRELLERYSKENESLKIEVHSLRSELHKTQTTMTELISKLAKK